MQTHLLQSLVYKIQQDISPYVNQQHYKTGVLEARDKKLILG